MATKPENPRILHILIPAATTLLVAIIGLGTAIYQTEKPIQLTEVALTAQAANQTAQAPTYLVISTQTALAPTIAAQTLQAAVALTLAAQPAPTQKPSAAPATKIPTSAAPSFTVINKLRLKVKITIDNVDQGDLVAGGAQSYPLRNSSTSVGWDVVKQTLVTGAPIGHDMGGIFSDIADGDELTIDNVVADQAYFYPILSNTSNNDCDVIINKGLISEFITGAIVPAYAKNITYGYYELYDNSNVTLNCAGQLYWWGTLPNQGSPDSFFNDVESDTGVIYFTH